MARLPMITHVRNEYDRLEKAYAKDDLIACLDILSECKSYDIRFNALCEDLQHEMITTLMDLADYPDEWDQTRQYLRTQNNRYHKEYEKVKKQYDYFMFRIDDLNLLTKDGREKYDYSTGIVDLTLEYLDLKCNLASYIEGYHYDRYELYRWFLRLTDA